MALDRALFREFAPFVGISRENAAVVTTRAGRTARGWLTAESGELDGAGAGVAAVAGTLREQVLAADVDPADTGADAEAGEAAAEHLVALAEGLGLPWVVRASGRPGGRHVVVLAPGLAPEEWARWCRTAGQRHDVGCQPRRVLRLMSSPHRQGLPAPVLAGPLRPEDVPAEAETDAGSVAARRTRRRATPARRPCSAPAGVDRSRREFGDALARCRAGWSASRAFAAAAVAGSKAAEQGELEWRRWVWCRVVTIVAAERGRGEAEAWEEFCRASPRRSRQMGRAGWRAAYWTPAAAEALDGRRPRRTRVAGPTTRPGEGGASAAASGPERAAAEQRQRLLLHTATDEALALVPRRPQFVRSVRAVVDALAPILVTRGGSVSERQLCELAGVARSTLRAVLEWAAERGVLYRAAGPGAGVETSSTWRPGPRAAAAEQRFDETRTTRWYTSPPPPEQGQANVPLLRQRHQRDRLLRAQALTSPPTDASVSTKSSPAARASRSLAHQRRWWTSLDADEQHARRAARRDLLAQLHPSRRTAWLDWLARRADLAAAAERTARGAPEPGDQDALAAAPVTVHRGRRDPAWTGTRTTPPPSSPLQLAAAA